MVRPPSPRVVLHLDMDAFYAAVEVREDPSLVGRPVIIGHRGRRGVVSTCSYEARRFGVHSAMPSVTAERLCPGAVWLPGRMALYVEVSHAIRAILSRHSPLVEPLSIDEAFLDLTGIARDLADGRRIAAAVKQEIRDRERLTSSAGVAPNKFLARWPPTSRSPMREADTVARFGGDEFVVMLSELDADNAESTAQACAVAEKIRSALAEPYVLKFQQEGNAETIVVHHCTSSVGVVLFINHEASAEDILKWADMAMYRAKEGGGNLICFFDSES